MTDITNQPTIQSITFHDRAVEFVYSEPQDVENVGATGILRTRVVLCPTQHCEGEFGDLMDAAYELLDKILVVERNPQPPTARR